VRGLERGEVAVSEFSRCREMPRFGALMVSDGRKEGGGFGSTDEATHAVVGLGAQSGI
jgi:hypothetical protein